MEIPDLFLLAKSSSLESDQSNPSRKRKFMSDHNLFKAEAEVVQKCVDLQLKDPLPLDWEQCLDLESGRMYYQNRKTLRRSWNWPKDQKIDLELNMSTLSNGSSDNEQSSSSSATFKDTKKLQYSSSSSMVALACLNCHLLVILSKSSPSCPNCKYVHSLPTLQTSLPKARAVNSLNTTLSLLN